MRYSRARIRHLAKEMLNKCIENDAFDVISRDSLIINNIMDTMENYFAIEDEVYEAVIENLQNRNKKLIPGSPEWEIAFNKTYEQEMSKRLIR